MDYNLYGMGHLHVSKIKFRHPIPDAFCPRRSVYDRQPSQEMDMSTCMSADLQVNFISSLHIIGSYAFGYDFDEHECNFG